MTRRATRPTTGQTPPPPHHPTTTGPQSPPRTASGVLPGGFDLSSPVRLPESTSGIFSIRHRQQSCFDIVSMREAILTGKRATRLTLDEPITIHQLFEGDRLWMTDQPIEVLQMQEACDDLQPRGRVLVGGLGLGMVAQMIAATPGVTGVDVVERSLDVAKLIRPHLDKKVNVIVDDVYDFLKTVPKWNWSCAFFDTWRFNNEGEWWGSVFPLRRIIGQRFGVRRVICWSEDVMLGQIVPNLRRRTEAQAHWYYRKGIGMPMDQRTAEQFVSHVGWPSWEARWGKFYPEALEEEK